jgi:tripartite-type tricarboxylate transporter receptor subunit TctC
MFSLVLVILLSGLLAGCSSPAPAATSAPAAATTSAAAKTTSAAPAAQTATTSAAAPTKAATTAAATSAAATTKAATLDPAVAEFYKGKTVTIYTTAAAGSAFDTWCRLLAKYLPDITGAKFVVENANAGGGKVILNQIYNGTVKPDGLSILYTATGAFFPAYMQSDSSAQYDIAKFKYVGGTAVGNQVLGVSPNGKIKSVEDLMKAKGLKFAHSNKTTAAAMANVLVIDLLGLDGKVITGFQGSTDKTLAVQQGDVSGTVVGPDFMVTSEKKGQVKNLLQIGTERLKPTENLPTMMEYVKLDKLTDNQKKLVGSIDLLFDCNQILMGPETPQDKVDFMAAAFQKVLDTTAIKADVEKTSGSPVLPYVGGDEITKKAKELAPKKADMQLWNQLLDKYVE